MINQENSQSILSCPLMNTPHQEGENMMSFNDGVNPLKIDCFNVIVPETVDETVTCQNTEIKSCDEEDKECASEIGACLANAGVDISNIPYSDVAPIIIQNRNNEDLEGYGASNSEIESFWDGYESVEPITMTCDEEPCEQVISEPEIESDLQTEIDNIINSCIG